MLMFAEFRGGGRRFGPPLNTPLVLTVSLPPTKEEVYAIAHDVCLFVCLSVSKITQKLVHGFG